MEIRVKTGKRTVIFKWNQGQFFPGRIEAPFLHVLDTNSSSFYVDCPRKCQKTYNFDIFKHFPKFTPLPAKFWH